MLEAPQLEAMQRLSAHAQEISSAAANTRSIELSRRTELRGAFTAAVQERTVAVSSTTSTIIPAMAAATVELWSTGGQAMEKARDCLTHTVERVGEMVTEAQERLVREECVRCAFKPSFHGMMWKRLPCKEGAGTCGRRMRLFYYHEISFERYRRRMRAMVQSFFNFSNGELRDGKSFRR